MQRLQMLSGGKTSGNILLPFSGPTTRCSHSWKMVITSLKLALAVWMILSSCSEGVTPAPLPTPRIWRVHLTPTQSWMGPALNSCTQMQAGTALQIGERPADALMSETADFSVRWDAPDNLPGSAAVVGWDELVVIVHPQNPLTRIDLAELRKIYSGNAASWSAIGNGTVSGTIQVWTQAQGEDVRQVFDRLFAEPLPYNPSVWLAPDPQAMRQAVASDPKSIGYLPKHWIDSSVRMLELAGVSHDLIRRPVLVLSQQEPQGAQRMWLECLNTRFTQ